MTSKDALASAVTSGRSRKRGAGRETILWEAVRDSLGALPGSILRVISPPRTFSCASTSGVEGSEGIGLTEDWELARVFAWESMSVGAGVDAALSLSSFTCAVAGAPSGVGVAPSSSFMPRSSGPRPAVLSASCSGMVGSGFVAGVCQVERVGSARERMLEQLGHANFAATILAFNTCSGSADRRTGTDAMGDGDGDGEGNDCDSCPIYS